MGARASQVVAWDLTAADGGVAARAWGGGLSKAAVAARASPPAVRDRALWNMMYFNRSLMIVSGLRWGLFVKHEGVELSCMYRLPQAAVPCGQEVWG